jgi:hypothetical protein
MTPEQYRIWLRRHASKPADRLAPVLEAVDAYEALSAEGPTDDRALQSIVAAASSPHRLAFEIGCSILVHLAVMREDCRQAIDRMASSSRRTARLHAIAYLDAALPESLCLSVVERALSDRSSQVRAMAVQQAEALGFRQLLPRLEAMLASEPHADVQRGLAFHVPMLRDGFGLEPNRDGCRVRVRTLRGGITSAFIAAGRFSDSCLRETVERLRKGEQVW